MSRTGWAVILGVLVLVCLGIVGAVLLPVLIGDQQAGTEPRVPSRTPTASQSPLPDVTSAPQPLDQALSTRFLFAHQSIGQDISRRIPIVYKSAKLPAPKVVTWNKAKTTKGPLVATATVGTNGNAVSKLRAFARLVNDAPRGSMKVALLAFNYQDVDAESDVDELFQSYVDTMTSLEAASPDISFLFATVPVTTANSWSEVDRSTITGLSNANQPVWQDNIARERFNTLIRERYADTGRLYDIAALQAEIKGDKVAAKQHEDLWYYVMYPGNSSNGKRLNDAGSRRLAKTLILLVNAAART